MAAPPHAIRLVSAIVLGLILAACGSGSDGSSPPSRAPEAGAPTAAPSGQADGDSRGGPAPPGGAAAGAASGSWASIPQIVADVQPSVVSVQRAGGEGSGVVWSTDGVIVTNHHVVEGVADVVVAFADGTRAGGAVIATDPRSDLAVIRTDRDGLPAAEFATEVPPVGSLAIAMGNPLGFENSVTAGIVSGLQRAVPGAARSAPALVDLVQTDAAISPGNSGGALVGEDGRLIGINVAYIPPQAGSVSIGFAIPAATVTDVVGQLLEDGTAEHTWLGVQPVPLTPQIAQRFGIGRDSGALVVDVVPDGPAAEAGVEPGDVIVAVGEEPVTTVEDLLSILRRLEVGQEVPLQIVRGVEEREVTVTLGALPTAP